MLKALLEAELLKYRTGAVRWTISNQFNETYLEKAIANFTDEAAADYLNDLPANKPVCVMELAYYLSDWEAPVPSRAWFD